MGDLSTWEIVVSFIQTVAFVFTAIFTWLLVWQARNITSEVRLNEDLRRLNRIRELVGMFYRSDISGRNLIEPELVSLVLAVDKPTQLKADLNHLSEILKADESRATDSPPYKALIKIYNRLDELTAEKFATSKRRKLQ